MLDAPDAPPNQPTDSVASAARRRHGAGEDPAKRDQILDGALRIFMADGFDRASMEDVRRAAQDVYSRRLRDLRLVVGLVVERHRGVDCRVLRGVVVLVAWGRAARRTVVERKPECRIPWVLVRRLGCMRPRSWGMVVDGGMIVPACIWSDRGIKHAERRSRRLILQRGNHTPELEGTDERE